MFRIIEGRKFVMKDKRPFYELRKLYRKIKQKRGRIRTRLSIIEWMVFKGYAIEVKEAFDNKIKRGSTVTLKTGGMAYRVTEVNGTHCTCVMKVWRPKETRGYPSRVGVISYKLPKSKLMKVNY